MYGGMDEVELIEEATRWRYKDLVHGASEAQPLDFHSPYGCSKGAGDQYVRDYARIYGLKSVVFRQSAIYGTRQFGVEDQGWVAWFVIAAVMDRPITIYGDGKQVRDMLWVEDLTEAYDLAIEKIDMVKGEVFNMGGGAQNTISVWTEFAPKLEKLLAEKIEYARGDWRPGDQRVFYADIRKAEKELGWKPKTNIEDGIQMLFDWVKSNKDLF
jgi:CDP-paratose 2-epimerase